MVGVPVGAAALSIVPSQLSSIPLHVSVVGVPGVQLLLRTPPAHVAEPVLAQAPTPHVVS
jgi:hypothetical protein